jgi:hypothetical protein
MRDAGHAQDAILIPAENPFGGAEFARVWDGWRGRRCVELDEGGCRAWYVDRSLGLVSTRAALPFGIPVFVDDHDPGRALWLKHFFSLGRALKAHATLYRPPRERYADVEWVQEERSVVVLDRNWRNRVQSGTRSRARRAAHLGYEIRPLAADELPRAERAVHETDRRHGVRGIFDAAFIARMLRALPNRHRLRVLGAERDGNVEAFRVAVATADYEVSWFLASTDRGRAEGAVHLLGMTWLESGAERGCRAADLGASPTAGVRQFKTSFGARPAHLHTGVRRWHWRNG